MLINMYLEEYMYTAGRSFQLRDRPITFLANAVRRQTIEVTLVLNSMGCTDFLGRECSDLGLGGWVSRNPNLVRICKSVRIIGRSLNPPPKKEVFV